MTSKQKNRSKKQFNCSKQHSTKRDNQVARAADKNNILSRFAWKVKELDVLLQGVLKLSNSLGVLTKMFNLGVLLQGVPKLSNSLAQLLRFLVYSAIV